MNFTKFEIRLLITLAICGAVSLISLLNVYRGKNNDMAS
ncbi:hypothetical protein IANJMKHF_00459 [Klebsiella phage CPRSA]|nr:hypothetical protein IANJMKHF_00459 [Klebsiella phage CPRSA]